jgi:hypothetical protein
MKTRGIAVVVVATGLVLAGCGSTPSPQDSATTRACNLLGQAQDQFVDTLNEWAANGGASSKAEMAGVVTAYSDTITRAADEALSAPPSIANALHDAAGTAALLKASAGWGGTTPPLDTIGVAIDQCKSAGVEMEISTPVSLPPS